MTEIDWDLAGYVQASQYRKEVLRQLSEEPRTPTGIADGTDHEVTHISRALRRLLERDLVELKVPEETQKGRIYGITEWGEEIAGEIDP